MKSLITILFLLVFTIRSFGLSGSTQLTPSNIGEQDFTFMIKPVNDEKGKRFRIIIIPKKGALSKYVSGSLSIYDGKTLIVSCALEKLQLPEKSTDVERSLRKNAAVYEFVISDKHLKDSQFVFRQTPEDGSGGSIPSSQFYWFYLTEFAGQ